MKDIARVVGMHHSTVSLALRNDARLPEKTRKIVQAAARKIGYRQNPLVSALMSYRARRRTPTYQMELAFLCATDDVDSWLEISEGYRRMWRGARERASERGYSLNLYPYQMKGASPKRVSKILQSRNIKGIVIAPMPVSSTEVSLDWEAFSVVELGFTLVRPGFHKIVHDYFHAMLLAVGEMRKLGYQRIGVALREHTDDKAHHLWRAAYMDEQTFLPASRKIQPLIIPEITVSALAGWMKKQKPDAILSIEPELIRRRLDKLGIEVPGDIGLASLGCYTADDPMAGICQTYEDMGAVAVEQLIAMIHRGETGVPRRTISTLIGGTWINGPTLPSRL